MTLYSGSQKYLDIENFLLTACHYSVKEILKRFEQCICFNTYVYMHIYV